MGRAPANLGALTVLVDELRRIRSAITSYGNTNRYLSWGGAPTQRHQLAGQSIADVRISSGRKGALRIGSLGLMHAETPALVQVEISHAFGPGTTLPGNDTYSLVAEVRWTTGKGMHRAELDVPAGGTAFTIAGADGLDVHIRPEGNVENADRAQVGITANLVGQCHPRAAQRTLVRTIPAQNNTVATIPRWSRSCRVATDTPAGFGGLVLRLFADAAGATLLTETPLDFDRVYRIPLAAKFFSVFDAAAAARIVRVIWDLQL